MKKRIISIIIATVMLSLGIITAFAGTETSPVDPGKATVKGVSLVLDGEIGLVFHFYAPSKYDKGYVELYKRDGDNNKRADTVVKAAISDCKKSANLDSDHLPTVAYNLSAVELSEEIYIDVYSVDDELLGANSFSAESYIRTILSDDFSDATAKEKEVARTLLNYGHFAQLACSAANGWTIGEDYPETKAYGSLKADKSVFDAYEIKWSTETGKPDNLYMSLRLDYKTGMHLYIPVSEKPTVTVNGESVTAQQSERVKDTVTYEIFIDGINALNLADEYEININGEVTVTLSALSFGKLATQNNKNQNTVNAVTGLYEFHTAITDYFN